VLPRRESPPPKAAPPATGVPDHTASAFSKEVIMGRSILLWLLGVPIPVIILLALFWR